MNSAGIDVPAFFPFAQAFPKACMEFLRVDEYREKWD
jgi:hypothetical protein